VEAKWDFNAPDVELELGGEVDRCGTNKNFAFAKLPSQEVHRDILSHISNGRRVGLIDTSTGSTGHCATLRFGLTGKKML
jgi:hypothetical protein